MHESNHNTWEAKQAKTMRPFNLLTCNLFAAWDNVCKVAALPSMPSVACLAVTYYTNPPSAATSYTTIACLN